MNQPYMHIYPLFFGFPSHLGLSLWLSSKESTSNAGDMSLIPGLGRSSGEGMATHTSTLAWKSHGQRSWADYSPWGHKEPDIT